jgi:hypothetical protein
MILTAGKVNVEELLDGTSTGKKITNIAVGASDTAVTGSETALTGELRKAVTSTLQMAGNIIQFTTTLEAADPAMTIKEVGLYNQNGVLVHRKVVADTDKAAGASLVINYRIKVQ